MGIQAELIGSGFVHHSNEHELVRMRISDNLKMVTLTPDRPCSIHASVSSRSRWVESADCTRNGSRH